MIEEKRRGRPPKQDDAPEVVADVQVEAPKENREMTFAEVMAWNASNRDKLPPAPVLPAKVKPKLTRF